MDEAFVIEVAPGRMVSTAVHAGHELRADLVDVIALDPSTRLREEDPLTDRLLGDVGIRVVARRSRFEVDLNRSRELAVYRASTRRLVSTCGSASCSPMSWRSRGASMTTFYACLATHLDRLAADGRFLVLDVHSYNHRRGGPRRCAEPDADNPEVNVGTGALDGDGGRARWRRSCRRWAINKCAITAWTFASTCASAVAFCVAG